MSGGTGGGRPLVVGIGGTGRAGSTTERALAEALRGAQDAGAEVRLFGAGFLRGLPLYQPDHGGSAYALEFLDAVSRADGLVVATPSYHAGVSAMVKNALDHMEDLRGNARPYLDGRAVGCVVTSAGCQAAGVTLSALRSIVHALRGWPTPLGVTVDTAHAPPAVSPAAALPADRACPVDPLTRCAAQLSTVGHQVADFARAFGQPLLTGAVTLR